MDDIPDWRLIPGYYHAADYYAAAGGRNEALLAYEDNKSPKYTKAPQVIALLLIYSFAQLRIYSFKQFLVCPDPAHIQVGIAESAHHSLNEPRLAQLLPSTELCC